MALAEARHAVSAAQEAEQLPAALAGAGSTPAASASPPRPAAPVQLTRVEAEPAPVKAGGGGSDQGAIKRYRVQAASPGLALLAEIDRGGGDGAQRQVLVGETIPGYGRIKSIGQRGTTWVVETEHGNIQ